MTQLLEKALAEVRKLPAEHQDAIASMILEELGNDLRGDEPFGKSQERLTGSAQQGTDRASAGQAEDNRVGKATTETSSEDRFDRELTAFQNLLPTLLQNKPGVFVAVYQGDVIDEDVDELALARRMERSYRGEFVLIRRIMRDCLDHLLPSPELDDV